MFHPVTSSQAVVPKPDSPHAIMTKLRGIISLPEAYEANLQRVEELESRLAEPKHEPLPQPSPSASEEEFTAYRNSLARADSDKAERRKLKEELKARTGRPSTFRKNPANFAPEHQEELLSAIATGAQDIAAKSRVTAKDSEDFAFLGWVYMRQLNTMIINRDPSDIRDVTKSQVLVAGQKETRSFVGARVQIPYTDQRFIWANPDQASSTVIASSEGLPPLKDIKINSAGDFRMLSYPEAIALGRLANAERILDRLKHVLSAVNIDEDVLHYLKTQVAAEGTASIDHLFV